MLVKQFPSQRTTVAFLQPKPNNVSCLLKWSLQSKVVNSGHAGVFFMNIEPFKVDRLQIIIVVAKKYLLR